VSLDRLIDAVWEHDPPDTAAKAVRNAVSTLRNRLAAAGAPDALITTHPAGYLLRVGRGQLDAQTFTDQVAEARQLTAAGEYSQAIKLLRSALSLWRGPALLGVGGATIEAAAARLNEQRLTVLDECLSLELDHGPAHDLIDELSTLVAEHPLREQFRGHLMLALYRGGRRSDALAVYRDGRRILIDELGIEPGPQLRALEQAVLTDAATLTTPSTRHQTSPPSPAQLPADVTGFVGRAAHLHTLNTTLIDEGSRPTRPVIISAISGTAGIGKTALAVHWAHQVAARFPDGQLYVNLRGFDPDRPPLHPAEAIRGFLDAFATPAEQVPAGLEGQIGLYRSLLAGKRVLVLLDNARDADQVRPLLPGAPGCLALVTSRNHLSPLVATEGARPLTLDLMTATEARSLLTGRLGAIRVAGEPDAVRDIITRCARLPLALAIAAARAATHPHFPLTTLATELLQEANTLDTLHGGDPTTDLRAVLSCSYQALSTSAATVFRLLGLPPGPDISLPATASLTGLPHQQTRQALAELTRAHLLTEHTPGRYTFHDLLRAYAGEQTYGHDTDEQRHTALHRMLDHYVHTALTATLLLNPTRPPIDLAPPLPGVTPEHLDDHDGALAWFTAEEQVLLAAVESAAAAGLEAHSWQLAWTLSTFLVRRGHWTEQVTLQRIALAAARRLGDQVGQTHTLRALAKMFVLLGRLDDAETCYRQAQSVYADLGDLTGQAHVFLGLVTVAEKRGDLTAALRLAQQAVDLYRDSGDQLGHANALNGVGWYHALLGDHDQAVAYCQRALRLLQDLGYREGEADTWDSLARAYRGLADYDQAAICCQRAVDLYRDLGDRYGEADELASLGDTHHAAGNLDQADTAWSKAVHILDQLKHPDAAKVRAKLEDLAPADTAPESGMSQLGDQVRQAEVGHGG
jgi:DNA-binding SARP family transcriptional activator/tetratricopeptide (TPR) repeat protein